MKGAGLGSALLQDNSSSPQGLTPGFTPAEDGEDSRKQVGAGTPCTATGTGHHCPKHIKEGGPAWVSSVRCISGALFIVKPVAGVCVGVCLCVCTHVHYGGTHL